MSKTCTCRSRMRAIRCRRRINLQRGSSALDTSSSPPPIPLSRRNQSSSDATFRLWAAESHFPVAGGFLVPVSEVRSTDRTEKVERIAMQVVGVSELYCGFRNRKRSSAMSTNRIRNPHLYLFTIISHRGCITLPWVPRGLSSDGPHLFKR